ncbi:MAG: hypothetical protein MZV65_00520, partial [Chromatiales bacterium]|nr:hypothetical protein [Chromatiales bacterium]
MLNLPLVTWLRFGLWLALGFVIYFAYSRHHSALETAKELSGLRNRTGPDALSGRRHSVLGESGCFGNWLSSWMASSVFLFITMRLMRR